MKYRAGHGEMRFSYLSVNYCLAVRGKLAARGIGVTGTVPVATLGSLQAAAAVVAANADASATRGSAMSISLRSTRNSTRW
jgi:hypothetical protein